jgi:magnesium-transporting ATPase (P-type)
MPLVVRAVFDQDLYYKKFIIDSSGKEISFRTNLREYYPFLYYVGQRGQIFTMANLFGWIFNGAIFGVAIFVMIMKIMDMEQIDENGEMVDIWMVSITLYTTIVLVSSNL